MKKANAEPDPMLTQAIKNLRALRREMMPDAGCYEPARPEQIQCWADKVSTAIADLQEVGPKA